MTRDFAMVDPGILHDPRFQALAPEARHHLLTILVSDEIGLEGFGPLTARLLAVTTGYSEEQVQSSLRDLEDAQLIGRETEPDVLLIREFWSHTTLAIKGINKHIGLLETGRLSRQLGRLEALWLADWVSCLQRKKGQKVARALALALERLEETRQEMQEAILSAVKEDDVESRDETDREDNAKIAEIIALSAKLRRA